MIILFLGNIIKKYIQTDINLIFGNIESLLFFQIIPLGFATTKYNAHKQTQAASEHHHIHIFRTE